LFKLVIFLKKITFLI